MLPSGKCRSFKELYGTAPGLWLKDNKILVMLPGPAREMHPMFRNKSSPFTKGRIFPEIDCYLQIRTAGIGESTVAEKVEHLFEGKALLVGYCAHAGMVDVRLSSLDADILNEEDPHALADACREALGEDFVASVTAQLQM